MRNSELNARLLRIPVPCQVHGVEIRLEDGRVPPRFAPEAAELARRCCGTDAGALFTALLRHTGKLRLGFYGPRCLSRQWRTTARLAI